MIPRLFRTTARVALALALSAPGAGVKAGLIEALSGSNFLAFGRGDRLSDGGTPTDPETITFDQPRSNVSISVTPEAAIPSLFRLQAFDSQGRQVATNSVTFGEGFGFYQTLKVSSPLGIKQVTL